MYKTLPMDTCAHIGNIGSPNIFSSFPQFTSSARTGMFAHNLPQLMVNKNGHFNRIFTGIEKNLKEMTFDESARNQDVEILQILPKYTHNAHVPVTLDTCPRITVMCRGMRDNRLHYFHIDRYHVGMNGFGFMTRFHNRNRIRKNEVIPAEMLITPSPSIEGSRYSFGENLNVCYGSFPQTIEDAFIIRHGAALNLMTDQISQVGFLSRPDRRPVNKFGTIEVEKPFPDIGHILGKDAILHASRPVSWMTVAADTDPQNMLEELPLQDDIYYGAVGAEIIDLDFVANLDNLTSCYTQVNHYLKSQESYYLGIYRTYVQYRKTYKPTQECMGIVSDAIYALARMKSANLPFLTESERKLLRNAEVESPAGGALEFLHTTITYRVDRKVSPGDKLSNLYGGEKL